MANSPQLEIMHVLECGKQAYIERINNNRPSPRRKRWRKTSAKRCAQNI